MVRLLVFFVVAVVLSRVLAHVPVIGVFFRSTGLIGIWITALLLAWGISHWGDRALRARRDRAQIRQLEAVDSPHNHGKIGALLLAQGRSRKALPHLEAAVRGEPDVAEWLYRYGCALLALRDHEQAVEAFSRCTAIDEEHAYGAAQIRLAEALSAAGRHAEALEAFATFERNHGPSPESAYRRGLASKKLGDRERARQAFEEVGRLSAQAARYQRRQAGLWTARARWASLF